MFPDGADLPLFSGTPQQVTDSPFQPEEQTWKQTTIPDLPPIDYDVVRERDHRLRQRRTPKADKGGPELSF